MEWNQKWQAHDSMRGKRFQYIVDHRQNLRYQQNLDKYALTIVVLNSFTSKVEELKEFVPALLNQLPNFDKHTAYLIDR